MGLSDMFLKNRPQPQGRMEGSFKMIDGYVPKFTNYNGSIYENELIRECIHALATHTSKLKVEFKGSAKPELKRKLEKAPNQFQTWSQFLYRLRTILEVHNTAYIVPIFDEYGQISGIFTCIPTQCEIVQYKGKPWLRYTFKDGNTASIEAELCGIMTKFQYRHDLVGETNHALYPTLDLISITNQGIQEATKSSASYRFWAKITNFTKTEDLAKERKRFSDENFSREANGGGILLFPNTYSDIHQAEAKPWVLSSEQMKEIRQNAFDYFGVNEDVLQNKAYGDKWSAFYEGAIETFAIQFSEVLTRMLYTFRERGSGNYVLTSSNRLQYLSNAEKLNVTRDLLDRGILSLNQAMEIWNLPPVEGGDVRIIRGEYYKADEKLNSLENEESEETNG
jgi:phage portal protein BeeE